MVIADHGPIRLARARALAGFYAREAAHEPADRPDWAGQANLDGPRGGGFRETCARRALALDQAVAGAEAWRRVAGWSDLDAPDRHHRGGRGEGRSGGAA